MQTLIFNGSPRKSGDTSFLIETLTAHLRGEITVTPAYHCSVQPCCDCRYCWTHTGCCIADEMQEVYRAIKEADHILIASPIYFSELTGPLLSILSRLQNFYASKRFLKIAPIEKPKTGGIILCGGGDGGPQKAESTAHTLLKLMRTTSLATVVSLQTDTVPACRDEAAVQATMRLAEQLNREDGETISS